MSRLDTSTVIISLTVTFGRSYKLISAAIIKKFIFGPVKSVLIRKMILCQYCIL